MSGKILLAGTLGYFMVTYLFFTLMAMYNQLFLLWIILLSLSFFGFFMIFSSINDKELIPEKTENFPSKLPGSFLMFTSVAIAFLWLSIVVPPAMNNTFPVEVEHYTTLVVQALDLAILLPASFIAGYKLYRKVPAGYKYASVYIVFLSILMTALSAKVIAMGVLGYNIIPVVFIIPVFNVASIILTIMILRRYSEKKLLNN